MDVVRRYAVDEFEACDFADALGIPHEHKRRPRPPRLARQDSYASGLDVGRRVLAWLTENGYATPNRGGEA